MSADEKARAARYRFEPPRRQFIAARGILRALLGEYLETPPAAVSFVYNAQGKPALAGLDGPRFNVAHSGNKLLCVVSEEDEVGIDLEAVRPVENPLGLAEQSFSPAECAELTALPPDRRLAAFFRGWTCKEAYLKARGFGLHRPLDSFDMALDPMVPPRLLADRITPQAPEIWSLLELGGLPGYAAALAVPRRAAAIDPQPIMSFR